jgi:hypothetical protein
LAKNLLQYSLSHENLSSLPKTKTTTVTTTADAQPAQHPHPRGPFWTHASSWTSTQIHFVQTDAFTNYTLVTAIENKEAETVAKAIFSKWFCKFSIPAQIHTDGGKEFVNKLSRELFDLLNIEHTKMTLAHPQCNTQVEVFNKTVKKYYLASFADDTTLDWENFLPALMLSYNTSYHSTIAMTPFELLFGTKTRLPSFPNPDIQRMHYGELTSAE